MQGSSGYTLPAVIIFDQDLNTVYISPAARDCIASEAYPVNLAGIIPGFFLNQIQNYVLAWESFPEEWSIDLEIEGTIYTGILGTENGRNPDEALFSILLLKETLSFTDPRIVSKMFAETPLGLVISDLDGTINWTNQRFSEMLGYEDGELIGKKAVEISVQGSRAEEKMMAVRVFSGEIDYYQIEKQYFRKDGSIMWANLSISVIRDEVNNIQAVVGMLLDITTEKITSIELAESEQFEKTINYFSSSIIDKVSEQDILNDTVIDIIQILGFEDCVIYLLDEEGKNLIQRAASSNKITPFGEIKDPIMIPVGNGIVGSVALHKKSELLPDVNLDERYIVDDEARQSELAVPIIYHGTILGVIDSEHSEKNFFTLQHQKILETLGSLLAVKITEVRALDNLKEKLIELHNKNEELKKYIDSNLQLENFAYIASHDLKEPLRTMIMFSQLLKLKYKDKLDEEGNEFLDHIYHSATNMNHFIHDLLTFSRVNSDEDLVESFCNLPQIMNEIIEDLRVEIENTGGEVVIRNLPAKLWGNEFKFKQLFQNLISNGLKFHRKGIAPRVSISFIYENNANTFCVEDNGIGIPEEYFDRIFMLFKKLHVREQYQGTGIGLALCKKIAEQMNGRIWVESVPGEGSCFYFTLPAIQG